MGDVRNTAGSVNAKVYALAFAAAQTGVWRRTACATARGRDSLPLKGRMEYLHESAAALLGT
ncbi:hypothetical protein SMC26_45130 [Actinomadura fulvescens]|uniref:Uncharacterized protein n=1 Tax=Actinomadura fulvescens TaxID=46160 RepID=A0ABN3R0S5_9ACTN